MDQHFKPITLALVAEDGLPDLDAAAADVPLPDREARLLRLGAPPLRECLRPLAGKAPSAGLLLALPEAPTMLALDAAAFLRRFAKQAGGAFAPGPGPEDFRGRAGGLQAVGKAVAALREGQAEFLVAGGIDTYRALYVLGVLDKERRLKTNRNLDGFIPGEGAAFLLLAGRRAARREKLPVLARLSPVAQALEEGHLYSEQPYRGEGLAAAVAALLEQADPGEPIREVYASMNGENHWAKEWGVCFLRHRQAFDPGHRLHHPADCFGDTGAACGPLLVGLAARGLAGGYRRGPCLVYASSDRGPRAALAVSAP
jgi:3-oxoacyl-[acyl-carrier-protein] synthase-1